MFGLVVDGPPPPFFFFLNILYFIVYYSILCILGYYFDVGRSKLDGGP